MAMTSKEKFDFLMIDFQQKSQSETAFMNNIFILDPKDIQTCKAVIAWSNINPVLDFSEERSYKDDWDWCWQFVRYDVEKLALLIGCTASEASRIVVRLKTVKLIFPDGTVNQLAYSVIKNMLVQTIQKTTGQNVRGRNESSKDN